MVASMSVVSFRVDRKIKEKMEKYKGKINWAEELRRFIEAKIRELEAEENLRRIISELEKMPFKTPSGFSRASVREDRDSS
jgi:hypothetical protein